MISIKVNLKFFFLHTFCQKIQNCPTFSKNCISALLFHMLLVQLHPKLQGTLKNDKNFGINIPHNSKFRGSLFIYFFRFIKYPSILTCVVFLPFFLILNTPQLGVEWYLVVSHQGRPHGKTCFEDKF